MARTETSAQSKGKGKAGVQKLCLPLVQSRILMTVGDVLRLVSTSCVIHFGVPCVTVYCHSISSAQSTASSLYVCLAMLHPRLVGVAGAVGVGVEGVVGPAAPPHQPKYADEVYKLLLLVGSPSALLLAPLYCPRGSWGHAWDAGTRSRRGRTISCRGLTGREGV